MHLLVRNVQAIMPVLSLGGHFLIPHHTWQCRFTMAVFTTAERFLDLFVFW